MPFSDAIVEQAFRRSMGQCECTRKHEGQANAPHQVPSGVRRYPSGRGVALFGCHNVLPAGDGRSATSAVQPWRAHRPPPTTHFQDPR